MTKFPVYRGNKGEVVWLDTPGSAIFVGQAEALIQKLNTTILIKEWKESSLLDRLLYAFRAKLPGVKYSYRYESSRDDTMDIYRSHEIETFRDAQKMPVGSIAFVYVNNERQVAVKRGDSKWTTTLGEVYTDMDMIGWTGLDGVYDGFLL